MYYYFPIQKNFWENSNKSLKNYGEAFDAGKALGLIRLIKFIIFHNNG